MVIYISCSVIGRLRNQSRVAAHLHMKAGHFGPVVKRGRIHYAALDAVEQHSGVIFTDEQIEEAAAGQPDRCLVIELEDT
jgi:hypothetical protein